MRKNYQSLALNMPASEIAESLPYELDARGIYYKELNEEIRKLSSFGATHVVLKNVRGQRYICDGITNSKLLVEIEGVPGEDLGYGMGGPTVVVHGHAQNGIANTMDSGKIIVHGLAGDALAYGMRGGKLFVLGDAGYRVGIHMKAYKDLYPVIIAGGCAGDFLGEYMAGGLIIILGLNNNVSKTREHRAIVGNYIGTGMHGGLMYIRGKPKDYQLGKEVRIFELDTQDKARLKKYLEEYCNDFSLNFKQIMKEKCIKLAPYTSRPYGKLYAY